MYDDSYLADCHDGGETFNPGETFCRTDNSSFTWFARSSISATGKANLTSQLEGPFENSDLSVRLESPPVETGTSETDVIFYREDLPGNGLGLTYCNDAVNTQNCDQHYVIFDSATPTQRVACHETGHAVGLTHGEDGNPLDTVGNLASFLRCMKTPDSSSVEPYLGDHNIGEINDVY